MADVTVNPNIKNPTELLSLGIRAYYVLDYNTAVVALSRASELIVAEHGDKHDSLGNVYLYYGKSLLELSREEAEPLGDAVPKDLHEESEDDEEEEGDTAENGTVKEQEKPEESKTNSVEKGNSATPIDAKDGSGDGNHVESKPVVVESKGSGDAMPQTSTEQKKCEGKAETGESSKTDSEDTAEKPDDPEEEPSDLQVAWEVLELAKLIFENRLEAGKKHLADTLIVLGEVSLENENFECAIADIKQGLEIQKSIYDNQCSRKLAESHYKLGIALSTNSQIDEAIENFNVSLELLRIRMKKLNESENRDNVQDEVKEIEGLIPEIEEKICDMKSFKEEAAKKIVSTMTEVVTLPKSEPTSSANKPTDISHLVKRKRKPEETEDNNETNAAKKPTP